MPWMVQKNGDRYCVHKENSDGTAGEKLECYGTEEEAEDYKKALYANAPEEGQTGFSFTELSNDADLKYIDGLAAGTFTAMSGDRVTFTPEELEEYVANSLKIIESTRTEKGEVVGLPIDKNAHDHLGGAGWIIGMELDKARRVIRFLVNWTKEGTDLIKGNIRRFFSPSTDPNNRTILGGSLTNWPATRNAKGQNLLRPVELSQTIKEIDMEKTLQELLADVEALTASNATMQAQLAKMSANGSEGAADDISPEMAAFISSTDGAAELGKEAQEIAQGWLKDAERKKDVKEFVANYIGGTPEKPFGIKVRPAQLAACLLSLPDKHRKFIQELLTSSLNALIEFAEVGYPGHRNFAQGKPVPAEYREALKEWVAAGKDAKDFFTQVVTDLGNAQDYNLVEFASKAKEE